MAATSAAMTKKERNLAKIVMPGLVPGIHGCDVSNSAGFNRTAVRLSPG
jgi:hypothetical protein